MTDAGANSRVLVLASRTPRSRSNGYDLRVAHLCALTPGEVHLAVVPLQAPDAAGTLDVDCGFSSVEVLDRPPARSGRASRWLRLSDDRYLQRSYPEWFTDVTDRLRQIVRRRQITHLVVFGGNLAEVAAPLGVSHTILDVCDSVSLTLRRQMDTRRQGPSLPRRVTAYIDLRRARASEGRFPRTFDQVTTISGADTRELRRLSGGAANVSTIPNGVAPELLGPLGPAGSRRGVVFWGNLAFAPNETALRFFLDEVYEPFLRASDVEVCIVGPNAPEWLTRYAETDEQVVLGGFVADLRAAVGAYPVMVNPMTTGSGLKNKVLEAFALGLAVVSTPLGVDAFPGVRDGTHLLLGDDGSELARAALRLLEDDALRTRIRTAAHDLLRENYVWEAVAAGWRDLLAAAEPHPVRDAS